MTIAHHTGDAIEVVRTLPDASVDFVATSPPFLALRNYNDQPGQWGSEPTPAAFLDNLLDLVAELRRALAPHGSIAVELGDTFAGSGGAGGDYQSNGLRVGQAKFAGSGKAADGAGGWPLSKSLTGVPTLFAWSLAYGRNLLNPDHEIEPWRVRNVIVWARNNPAVGALGDKVRPATSYITVACPSPSRWFDLDAVRSALSEPDRLHRRDLKNRGAPGYHTQADVQPRAVQNTAGAPPLDHWGDEYDGDLTWLVNTAGSPLAHYAMWPAKLAERLVLSMCPREVCRQCGEPRRRMVDITPSPIPADLRSRNRKHLGTGAVGVRHDQTRTATTTRWTDCGHGDYRPGMVLDPFAGTGTTLAVADIHGRDAIGIDLDPDNTQLHQARYDEVKKALFGTPPPMPGSIELFPEVKA